MTCPNCGATMEQHAQESVCLYCGFISKNNPVSSSEQIEEVCDNNNSDYQDIKTLNEEFKLKLERDEHCEFKVGLFSAIIVTIGIVIIAIIIFCIL